MRLGLFGGSFNPIHNGHLAIARQAHKILALDRTLFIPTGDPPHKQDGALAPATTDMKWRVSPSLTRLDSASDIEISRQGKSYSIDTVRELRRRYGSETCVFLIGLDAFLDLPSWREPDALLAACSFVVISRPGQSFQSLQHCPSFKHHPTTSRWVHTDRLDCHPSGHTIICLPLPPRRFRLDIRHRVQRGHAGKFVAAPVESYILRQQLYREDQHHTHI
jgi:nicotinate-nucleotide adenylyltransferase